MPRVKLWIDGLVSDYARQTEHGSSNKRGKAAKELKELKEHATHLAALKQEFSGTPSAEAADDTVRRLLAAGIVQYVYTTGGTPDDIAAKHVVQDVVVFALWQVVQANALPGQWQESLARITSLRMADLVAQARSANAARVPGNFAIFARALTSRPVAQGALNLLRDMADPGRGGTALTAIALAAGLPRPESRRGPKSAAIWVFTALVGGALGAEGTNTADAVDKLARDAWEWITAAGTVAQTGRGGDVVTALAVDQHHGGGLSGAHGEAIADDLIQHLFH